MGVRLDQIGIIGSGLWAAGVSHDIYADYLILISLNLPSVSS